MRTRTQSTHLSSLKKNFTSTGTALNTEQVLGVQDAQQGRRIYGFFVCAALAFAGGYWYLDSQVEKTQERSESGVANDSESAASLALQRKTSPSNKTLNQASATSLQAGKSEAVAETKVDPKLVMTLKLKNQLSAGQFASDSVELTPATRAMLDDWARRLKKDRWMQLRIAGHADERGTAKYNESLSLGRAEAAKKYLVAQGVSASRVKTKGYGKNRPLVKGEGESIWAKNRRIELKQRSSDTRVSKQTMASQKSRVSSKSHHLSKN